MLPGTKVVLYVHTDHRHWPGTIRRGKQDGTRDMFFHQLARYW